MPRQCKLCGKKVEVGNQYTYRGIAKYKGGVGRKITGKTTRVYEENGVFKFDLWIERGPEDPRKGSTAAGSSAARSSSAPSRPGDAGGPAGAVRPASVDSSTRKPMPLCAAGVPGAAPNDDNEGCEGEGFHRRGFARRVTLRP